MKYSFLILLLFFTFQVNFITPSQGRSSPKQPETQKTVAELQREIDAMKARQNERERIIEQILQNTQTELNKLIKALEASLKESTELRRALEASRQESNRLRARLREQDAILDLLRRGLGEGSY